MEVTLERRIDWCTEDTDIGEPPVHMLPGIEVNDDDDWQSIPFLPVNYSTILSVDGRHSGRHRGNHIWSDTHRVHEDISKSARSAPGTKNWSKKDGMDVPGSIDPFARTGLYPICNPVLAGSGPTAWSGPLSVGGEYSAGCDQTATSPSFENGDGVMPSLPY